MTDLIDDKNNDNKTEYVPPVKAKSRLIKCLEFVIGLMVAAIIWGAIASGRVADI